MQYERKIRENKFLIGEVEELKRELRNVRGYTLPQKLMKTKSTTTTMAEEEEAEIGVSAAAAQQQGDNSKMEFTIGDGGHSMDR